MISATELENVNLLVVGAGGIGCELIKNLILSGFNQMEVIDLDTIELSNLNRQFLFQKNHVGQSKAVIARQSALRFNPHANIIAHHDSIMNQEYDVNYFKKFTLVLNALDNKAARSHVNRLCLAADVPLIESGSAGYLGQVTVIKKGLTECYDCLPKPTTKSFPGCTIRNTPSEPIHCIVWAKHLFNQLFGSEDPDEAVSPDTEDPENMADAGKVLSEKQSELVRLSTRTWAKETNYDGKKIFNKLFNEDIKYLLSMSKLWEKRKSPEPIEFDSLDVETENTAQQNGSEVLINSQKLWSIKECRDYFCSAINLLKLKLEEQEDDKNPILVWDKDDEDALVFVAAAANLRSSIFSIQLKSKFDVKSLAGNIIPAIASTNAIVAGLIVLQAIKIIKNKTNECKTVYLRDIPLAKKLIVNSELVKPNEKCYVCAAKPEITLKLNTNEFTVKQLEAKILKQELAMIAPDVEIDDGSGRIMISSEEGETEGNNDKQLSSYGLTNGSRLKCDDFLQNYELTITLVQCEKFENGKDYEIMVENQLMKDLQEQIKEKIDINDEKTTSTDELMSLNAKEDTKKRSLPVEDYEEIDNTDVIIKKKRKTIELRHEVIEELCEDSSNSSLNMNTNGNGNGNGNGHAINTNNSDDDVIECSSSTDNDNSYDEVGDEDDDDDIVEIDQSPTKKIKLLDNNHKILNKKQNNSDDDEDDIITL